MCVCVYVGALYRRGVAPKMSPINVPVGRTSPPIFMLQPYPRLRGGSDQGGAFAASPVRDSRYVAVADKAHHPHSPPPLSRTSSNPFLPLSAFCPNLSTVNCSILCRMASQPPTNAVISAFCSNRVLPAGSAGLGV